MATIPTTTTKMAVEEVEAADRGDDIEQDDVYDGDVHDDGDDDGADSDQDHDDGCRRGGRC